MQMGAGDTQRAYVDTRGGGTVRITGMSKLPVISSICKAGNTTGWTCGTVTPYNQSVLYARQNTRTTGLARSTVCLGDSGGAYIPGTARTGHALRRPHQWVLTAASTAALRSSRTPTTSRSSTGRTTKGSSC